MQIRRSGHPCVSLSTLMCARVLCLSCSMAAPPCGCPIGLLLAYSHVLCLVRASAAEGGFLGSSMVH